MHWLIAAAFNAIPLIGVWRYGWSVGMLLLLFWLESVLLHAVALIKIRRHQVLTPKRGHVDYVPSADPKGNSVGSYFAHYAQVAIIFTLAHGFFLGVILFMLAVNRPAEPQFQIDWASLRIGALWLALVASIDLFWDWSRLGQRSFLWLEIHTGKRLTRVLLMHLTLIFGMGAMAFYESPMSLLLVFLGLKWLLDGIIASAPDDMARDAGFSAQAPALMRFIERHSKPGKESVAVYWARVRRETIANRDHNEKAMR